MKHNDDGTANCFDLLIPWVGELIGGSEREQDYQKLKNKMQSLEMDLQSYWWYLELRKYGTV